MKKGAVSKVIFQTPSPLRGTPSINRGRVEILPVLAPPLFIEEVARNDRGVF